MPLMTAVFLTAGKTLVKNDEGVENMFCANCCDSCIPDCTPLDLTTPPCPTSTLATVTQKVTGTATAW